MKKILICDDDSSILDVLQIILEEGGYETERAVNGEEVLEKVNTTNADLIFLDIWMPGLQGTEVVKQLKQYEHTKNTPIILLSALNEIENSAKESGADDFVRKPFDMHELLSLVKKYIG
jgi:CheY-like chemotaxis protein